MTVLAQVKVGGRPRTKGSLRVHCLRDRRHSIHLEEEVAESKAWRAAVAKELREAQLRTHGKLLAYAGPVEVRLVFHFPRTEAKSGGPVPSHATEWPTNRALGDVDKLARNVLDALSAPRKRANMPLCAALIEDDSQVVLLSVGKFWSEPDREPGVDVLVLDIRETPKESLDWEYTSWDCRSESS